MGLRGPGAKPVRRKDAPASKRKGRPAWKRAGLDRAGRVIAFIQSLKLTAGVHAGKKFVLRPWQKDHIRAIYRSGPDGRRIVRTALLTVGRKNGKTQLAAALALCHLCGPESEPRGECYSAASDRNQAARIFRELEAFILADADLGDRINIQRFAKRMEVMDGDGAGSTYEALPADERKAHSLSPSFVCADELARWKGRELFDALETGVGAREQPLIVVISTQSNDPLHVMSELVTEAEQIRDGIIIDPSFIGFVYQVPDDADPWDESLWHLANPALGDFRSLEEMRQFAEKAKRLPSKEAVFRNHYLNQRVDADERFISAADWKACGGEIDVESLLGRPCFGGLDKSSTTDLTALTLYFPEDAGAVLAWFWLPKSRIAERVERDRVKYDVWAREGYIETPNGRAIDNYSIVRRLAEINALYDVGGIAFDDWRMEDLKKLLDDEGIELPMKPFRQGYKTMGPAVDAMEAAVIDGHLRHGDNPVMTWNMANIAITTDPAGNRKIDKERSREKVDGAVALCMAIGLHAREPAPVQYDFDRPLVLVA